MMPATDVLVEVQEVLQYETNGLHSSFIHRSTKSCVY
jgi:hypothetical protein